MKKVLVSGTFNIIHPGHLRLFRAAKDYGDELIVAVESDYLSKNAHLKEELRLEAVKSLKIVNRSFIYNDSIINVINKIKPDYIVKGREHENNINIELSELEKYGGKLIFTSGENLYSSLNLINKELKFNNSNLFNLQKDYLNRHKISSNKLLKTVEAFKKINICVIGDLIIDEYINCETLGLSSEDPTIVVTPINSDKYIGGAGIVALHAAGLGAKVNFISVHGPDDLKKFTFEILKNSNINNHLIQDFTRPTTLKQRIRSQGKTLLRISKLHQESITSELQTKILKKFNKIVDECDLIVFSDFNYGCLPQALVDKIVGIAKSKNVMLVADSQSSSQIGNIARFSNMELITPTEREARISTHNREDGLIVLANILKKNTNSKHIILKLGEEGLIINTTNLKNNDWFTDQIYAMNKNPIDVSGAGDSLLITSSLALRAGASIWEAAYLGSIAAAIQVGRVGNIPLNAEELTNQIKL